MSSIALPSRPVALRPLIMPSEHGGWGLVLEPVLLGMIAAPSWAGLLIAIAALAGFLMRQPAKLALQDALKHRNVPRTRYCWMLAAGCAGAALVALTAAATVRGIAVVVPIVAALPLVGFQLLRDTRNRGRELAPEIFGAIAASSIAAAIAFAGGSTTASSGTLGALVAARCIPSILYVRALLGHSPRWPAVATHTIAAAAAVMYSAPLAAAAVLVLLGRALWGLSHPPAAAKTIGWREIAFGALFVVLVGVAYR